MKKTFLSIITITTLFSCNTFKRERFKYIQEEKQSWINSYKYEAFYGCINEGLKNDSLKIILSNKDLFAPNLNIDFFTIDQARELGRDIAKNIPKPFIKIDKGEEKLASKKFISFSCLNYFASRELDSIAKNQYEFFKKESSQHDK
jgi:hypothetical protein